MHISSFENLAPLHESMSPQQSKPKRQQMKLQPIQTTRLQNISLSS